MPEGIQLRQVKYLNNIVEQDHRFIKKRIRPMLGLKSLRTAKRIIAGIEAMYMIKKGTTRGRLSMSNKPKKLTKEQQLLKEIELLRAENAYLKKLRASGINIPSRLLKQNLGSSTNSEKNSN